MKYHFSYSNPNTHYLDIQFEVDVKNEETVQLQLPAWRPGRYELGNFAKNIQKWEAYNEKGEQLSSKKLTKDQWEVKTGKSKMLIVRYNYFAFELNAGSTYLDENQLYVNPVNCCLMMIGREDEACEISLKLPKSYDLACSMEKTSKHKMKAKNFDELADSPFIASASLQKHIYKIKGTTFYIWFQGLIKGDFKKLIKDFTAFSAEQGKLFNGFPFKEYHFLFQIQNSRAYHGVEHENSTVISLGPSYDVLEKNGSYDELLGVSSHELFHAWNVKRIRPVEMLPYDFSKENYSKLGYLAEGATTWYGDIMLYRSSVFDEASFLKTFDQLMNRHFNNPGVRNLSVAESSFDTWLDGYEKGVPNRKSSIYTEGALITFMLDVEIRKANKNKFSFDDVMRSFYKDIYLKGKGVSEKDYQQTVECFAGKKLNSFFKKYVNGSEAFLPRLKTSLKYLGLELIKKERSNYHESHLGFVCDKEDRIIMIHPDSPAEKAGLSVDDRIDQINGVEAKGKIGEWCKFFDGELSLSLTSSVGTEKKAKIQSDGKIYFADYQVKRLTKLSKEQENNWKAWLKS